MATSRPSALRQVLPVLALTGAGGAFLAKLDPPPVLDTEDQASLAPVARSTPAVVAVPGAPSPPSIEPTAPVTAGGSDTSAGAGPTSSTASPADPAAPTSTPSPADPVGSVASVDSVASVSQSIPAESVPPADVPVDTTAGSGAIEAPTVPASTVPGTPECLAEAIPGLVVRTRWGPVQVEIHASADGSVICSADAPVTPTDHRKSVRINERALPRLNAAAVEVQGTTFDVVSGATITSNAYKLSLQSILDGLRPG